MSIAQLNADFAAALGLPKGTTRAVLTLEVGEVPRLHITCYIYDAQGRPEVTADGERLKSIQFKVRLEPFNRSDYDTDH